MQLSKKRPEDSSDGRHRRIRRVSSPNPPIQRSMVADVFHDEDVPSRIHIQRPRRTNHRVGKVRETPPGCERRKTPRLDQNAVRIEGRLRIPGDVWWRMLHDHRARLSLHSPDVIEITVRKADRISDGMNVRQARPDVRENVVVRHSDSGDRGLRTMLLVGSGTTVFGTIMNQTGRSCSEMVPAPPP